MGLMEKPQCLVLSGGVLEEYYGDNTNGNKNDKVAGNIQGARLGIHGASHQRELEAEVKSNKPTQLGVRKAKTSPQQRCGSIFFLSNTQKAIDAATFEDTDGIDPNHIAFHVV